VCTAAAWCHGEGKRETYKKKKKRLKTKMRKVGPEIQGGLGFVTECLVCGSRQKGKETTGGRKIMDKSTDKKKAAERLREDAESRN